MCWTVSKAITRLETGDLSRSRARFGHCSLLASPLLSSLSFIWFDGSLVACTFSMEVKQKRSVKLQLGCPLLLFGAFSAFALLPKRTSAKSYRAVSKKKKIIIKKKIQKKKAELCLFVRLLPLSQLTSLLALASTYSCRRNWNESANSSCFWFTYTHTHTDRETIAHTCERKAKSALCGVRKPTRRHTWSSWSSQSLPVSLPPPTVLPSAQRAEISVDIFDFIIVHTRTHYTHT